MLYCARIENVPRRFRLTQLSRESTHEHCIAARPIEEMAEFLAGSPLPDEILAFRLSDAALDRARDLLDKNKAGALTLEEDRELDRLLVLDDLIGLIRARVLASQSNSKPGAPSSSPDT